MNRRRRSIMMRAATFASFLAEDFLQASFILRTAITAEKGFANTKNAMELGLTEEQALRKKA